MIRPAFRGVWLALGLALMTVGCTQTLYSQLPEQDANEVHAALLLAGVDATKRPNEKAWAIDVDPQEMPLAMQVLEREGLPRLRYTGLSDLFKREGLVSTPTEERVRFIHGVSQELSRTLSLIDGVLAARVHIVLPQNDPLADRTRPSSASVFIKHRADADLIREQTAIKSLIVRSIEGLGHDHVHLSLFAGGHGVGAPLRVPQARWLGFTLSRQSARLANGLLVGVGLIALLAIAGWLWWRRPRGEGAST
jgi:type III secretion protein J